MEIAQTILQYPATR